MGIPVQKRTFSAKWLVVPGAWADAARSANATTASSRLIESPGS
jgi:hypothetical protein